MAEAMEKAVRVPKTEHPWVLRRASRTGCVMAPQKAF